METVIIDCAGITTADGFHQALSEALHFDEDYGANLDALFDYLTQYRKDRELILNNWHKLEYALKDYSGKALYVFHCACLENRHLTVTLHP